MLVKIHDCTTEVWISMSRQATMIRMATDHHSKSFKRLLFTKKNTRAANEDSRGSSEGRVFSFIEVYPQEYHNREKKLRPEFGAGSEAVRPSTVFSYEV